MKIALIQQEASQDKQHNLTRGLEAARRAAGEGAEVIGFAELAFEPFYPQRPASGEVKELAEPIPGPTTEVFRRLAAEREVVVVLNLFERDGDATFDTSPVIDADGTLLGGTRMVHITEYDCFHEQGYYTAGDRGAPVYSTRAGKIGVAICYDRHYPEYMRAGPGWSRGRDRAPGRGSGRVARGPLRGRDARGGLPERLLYGAVQPRRQGRAA